MERIQLAKVDMTIQIKFLKIFEQFLEAVPQFVLSALYFGNHHKSMTQNQIIMTWVTLALSLGSIVFGIITSLTAARQVYDQGLETQRGVTQLHIAAKEGNVAEVEYQIRTGAKVDQH